MLPAQVPSFNVLQTSPRRIAFLQASGEGAIADVCVRLPESAIFDCFFRVRTKAPFTRVSTTFGDCPHRYLAAGSTDRDGGGQTHFRVPGEGRLDPFDPVYRDCARAIFNCLPQCVIHIDDPQLVKSPQCRGHSLDKTANLRGNWRP